VEHHQLAIAREMDIELEGIGSKGEAVLESGEGVLWREE
jgi:hypothetical protein